MIKVKTIACECGSKNEGQTVESLFSDLIGQLFRRLNLLNRDQKVCYGITLAQCYTIETLAQRGLISMNDLSRSQGVTISTMTRVIDVLVRDEIVERVASPDDRRKVCIQLTEKGKDVAQKLKKCTEDYTKIIFDNVPPEKKRAGNGIDAAFYVRPSGKWERGVAIDRTIK